MGSFPCPFCGAMCPSHQLTPFFTTLHLTLVIPEKEFCVIFSPFALLCNPDLRK